MMKEYTIIDLAEWICQCELCWFNQLKTVTVMVDSGLLRCMHSVTSVGVQMSDPQYFSHHFSLNQIRADPVTRMQTALGVRPSAQTAEGFSK
jgi:hypothetical protein